MTLHLVPSLFTEYIIAGLVMFMHTPEEKWCTLCALCFWARFSMGTTLGHPPHPLPMPTSTVRATRRNSQRLKAFFIDRKLIVPWHIGLQVTMNTCGCVHAVFDNEPCLPIFHDQCMPTCAWPFIEMPSSRCHCFATLELVFCGCYRLSCSRSSLWQANTLSARYASQAFHRKLQTGYAGFLLCQLAPN